MPTYADALPYQVTAPVRLTISRGAPREPGSSEYSHEVWEEETLMDHEHIAVEGVLNENSEDGASTITLSEVLQRSGTRAGSGLLVVDTNALLSHLPLLDALHAGIMHLNMWALQHGGPSSPLTLIIPAVVLSELDGLKRSPRRSDGNGKPVGIAARDATHWILSSLQRQKKAVVRAPTDDQEVMLPQSSWGVHVQTKANEVDVARSVGDGWHALTPDERIIALCTHLQAQTQQPTFLCTNDTNARARAEVEGVRTLAIHDVLGRRSASDFCPPFEECQRIAQELLEQWIEQVSGAPAHSGSSSPSQLHPQGVVMHSDEAAFSASSSSASLPMSDDVDMAMDDEPHTAQPSSSGFVNSPLTSPSAATAGRSLTDSIHAVQGYVAAPRQHCMPAYSDKPQQPTPAFDNHRPSFSPRAVPIPLSGGTGASSTNSAMSRSLSPSADRLSSASMWAPGNTSAPPSHASGGRGHGMSRAWNSYGSGMSSRAMPGSHKVTGSNTTTIVGQRSWGAA